MSEITVTVDETTLDVTVAVPGPQGPSGGGSATLAEVLANDNDANALAIANLADPTNDQDADTKAAREAAIAALALGTAAQADTGDFDAAGSAATAQSTAEGYADAAVATHSADTTSVHGIADTSALETTSGAQAKADAAQAAAEAASLPSSATTADVPDSPDKRYVTDSQRTVLGNTSGTNTGDQTSVTGNAGTATKLATARNIDGQAFDGSADITVIAPGTHAAPGKTTPVDADELAIVDSAASNVLKKLTWANLKATLKTYFDTVYSATGAYVPGGTDVAVADGGTGASDAATARTNLGVPAGSGTSTGINTGDQTLSDATISTSDITTNDVSTSKHGFAPKAPNDATKFLDGTGAWSVPAGGSSDPTDVSLVLAAEVFA